MKDVKCKLNPYWVTGFVDAEGCFYVRLAKSKNHKTGWWIQACFEIGLHVRDKDLLLEIKSFFNDAGNVYIKNNNSTSYQVRSITELTNIIIPHFDKYPLISQKQSDYILFRNIIELINKNEHLTKDGITKIVNLKASLNKGLSDLLKINFPYSTKIERSKINIPTYIDPYWIAGFFSGEGCLFINIHKAMDCKTGYSVKLQIRITQHIKDKLLLENISIALGCGNIKKHSKNAIVFIVSGIKNINEKIIPFFTKYDIKGIKLLDFQDFCVAAKIITEVTHITLEGLEKIRKIKSRMNKARYTTKKKQMGNQIPLKTE
jgi:hypothetical protein